MRGKITNLTQISTNNVKDLLELIGKVESRGNYNIIWGGKTVPLTTLTIKQVLDFQSNLRVTGAKSTAAGKYQIIYQTLKNLQEVHKIPLDTKFNEETQDELAIKLLNRRGLEKFLEGSISLDEFMLNLSKEWASLPKDTSGVGYYDGDSLNRALVRPDEMIKVLNGIRSAYKIHGKS